MRFIAAAATAICAVAAPCAGWCCGGPAGGSVSVAFDGQKYAVTNIGRSSVQVTFTAFGNSYELQLAPGQTATPATSGLFQQPMSGYQSCYASPSGGRT